MYVCALLIDATGVYAMVHQQDAGAKYHFVASVVAVRGAGKKSIYGRIVSGALTNLAL